MTEGHAASSAPSPPGGPAGGAPAKRKGLLAFYMAMGTLLALVVALCFAWTPLRLRYAIYRLERVTEEDVNTSGFDQGAYGSWSGICLHAALNGNRRAMNAFMPRLLWKSFDRRTNVSVSATLNSGLAYGFVLIEPELFLDLLDERSDKETKKIISDIEVSCLGLELATREGVQVFREPARDTNELVARLSAHSKATHREVATVAQRTLVYLRHRFAKELTEARIDR